MHSYDAHRSWDGIDALALALRSAGDVRRRAWIDVAVLHGAMARTAELVTCAREEEAPIVQRVGWLEGTHVAVDEASAEAARLGDQIASRFERMVRDHAFELLTQVLGAASEEAVAVQAQRLKTWWDEPGFREDLVRWQEQARREIDEWFARADEALGRRFASAEFRHTFPELAAVLPTDDLAARPMGFAKIASLLRGGARALAERSVLYGVVKSIGGKFAPWGVIKWTKRFATAARALGPIGLALDVIDFRRAGEAEEKREKARQEAVAWVQRSTAQVIEDVLRKSDDDGVGPLGYLAALAGQLADLALTVASEAAATRREGEALAARRATYERLLRSAQTKWNLDGAEVNHG